MTHFTANDSLEVEATEKIVLSRSFCDSPRSRNCYQSFDMNDVKHILMQLLVLIRWQALVSGRNYLKVIFHLLLPTLCVLFYGFSVGNDMTEVNLGVGTLSMRSKFNFINYDPSNCQYFVEITPIHVMLRESHRFASLNVKLAKHIWRKRTSK